MSEGVAIEGRNARANHGDAGVNEDNARVDTLHGYAILDSEPEPRFDALTKISSLALDLPVTLITLVDAAREWTKSAYGVELASLPTQLGFGSAAIAARQLLVIEDISTDPRFAAHPLVTGPLQLRFFAGVPLEVRCGHQIGSLCVFGQTPHAVTPRETELLLALAGQVVQMLELRRTESELEGAVQSIRTLATLIPICSHCRKVRDDENHWSTLERLVQAKTGSRFTHGICPDCVREHYPDAADELLRLGK
ncbi:Diguanylate cyclase (GGDEF domain) with GAF sensor [Enhygromyxa salina]|uniref:Diguanylate cyclase (GGDEF domain) with GAF sensor n=1 Tax=Enhygromyxa salina TaxID=215803 RepID=A0A0C2D0H2_9BACT|nr:GAF domain-containing protein [Enhygromyxa salina]KIG15345.1 Diguanylate cyclase (GGDEF domain) with GAF sensor [Enhygromyxa salina]